ncbi:hypothetical protein SKAU_G00005520 [Synaphobranchus kaupii]|uniref:Uncharacterized protein n=1 Tax=Synaphobranchus kaupii TaxID=118154 RepID=A0A9Q1G8Z6_SYNKA|nr:hypothetical protein SKAU_G00005520 [Synaphobranchus kaupii]
MHINGSNPCDYLKTNSKVFLSQLDDKVKNRLDRPVRWLTTNGSLHKQAVPVLQSAPGSGKCWEENTTVHSQNPGESMNIAEPEYANGRPGGTPTDVWQGGSKLQCSEVVDLHGPAHRHPHEVQSPDEPGQGADRWGCDRFSPSSLSQARLRDLLKTGSPKTRGLERLREKVRQQRLDAKSAVTPNDPQFTLVTHRGQITRRICRVTFDPPTPPPALRVLSTEGVNSINDDNDPPRGMMSPSMEKTGGGKDVTQTDGADLFCSSRRLYCTLLWQ